MPFTMLPDSAITVNNLTYYDDTGAPRTIPIASEWLRYTTWQFDPSVESLSATKGAYYFRTNDGLSPNGFQCPGAINKLIPKGKLTIRWHRVPFNFLLDLNSPANWLGRVNQLPFYGYSPGEMLFEGIQVNRYLPPVPDSISNPDSPYPSSLFLADFDYVFSVYNRSDPRAPVPAQKNWIYNGANVFPHISDGLFHTLTSGPNPAMPSAGVSPDPPSGWTPTYLSFPVQILFTDPGALAGIVL
jgi:hypothetical protein